MTAASVEPILSESSSREQLLSVAIDLVWNASYESVGVNEICTRAEVTKGCFYYYFDSKAALFHAAADHFWHAIKPRLDSIISPDLNALEQLCALARHGGLIQQEYSHNGNPVAGCPFHSTAALIGHREPLIAEAGRIMTERQLPYLETIISNLLKEGYAQSNLSPSQLARICHQYYQGIMQYGRTFQSREKIEEDIAIAFAQLLGLKEAYHADFFDAHTFNSSKLL